MYLFIEKGLTGGISYIAKRYSKANNKYMEIYDPAKPLKYIEYLDKNNLYDLGMSQYLPHGRFKWLKNEGNFDVNSISEDNSIEYILEVDLKYPDADCQIIAKKFRRNGIKVGNEQKLIPNLGDKTNYVVHYKNLQLYLSLEMKLTKIHMVLKFKQSDRMKNYIDFNTEKKKKLIMNLKKIFLN